MEASDKQLLHPGERFQGYLVEKQLGHGGLGAVYLVRHEVLDTLFALKVLYPEAAATDATSIKRFLREARLATRIRHPNLVAVHDCGRDALTNLYYLVMDYVSGSSLRNVLAFEGRLGVARAADIVAQVASALRAAQPFQVVHRDIKPENIMIQPNGLVKLVDLGIAKAQNLGDSLRTNTDSVFGTPSYVSPEQAQCSADVDARADIYSLGIVFYEMLVGKCPYVARNPAQILAQILSDDDTPDVRDAVRDVDPAVAVLIRRMTAKDRERRLGSFDAVLAELGKIGGLRLEVEGLPSAALAKGPALRSHGEGVGLPSVALAKEGEIAAVPEEGMKTLLDFAGRKAGEALCDLEQDASVQDFLATRRKQKEQRQKVMLAAIVGIVMLLVVLLVVI